MYFCLAIFGKDISYEKSEMSSEMKKRNLNLFIDLVTKWSLYPSKDGDERMDLLNSFKTTMNDGNESCIA